MSEREYYLAEGEDLAKAKDFIEERTATSDKINAIAKKYGGEAVINGRFIIGLTLSQQPEGWSKQGSINGRSYYMPKRTSKALKAIHEELRSVRMQGAREFHNLFCQDGGKMVAGDGMGMRILFTVWEWIGDTLLLSVPVGSDFTPNGSRKLKMSEYWAMKEAAPEEAA